MFILLPFVVDWPLNEDYRYGCPSPSPKTLVPEPHHRVVLAVRRALLQGYQCVVGDLDVLGAHLRAALGDVAEAQAVLFLCLFGPTLERVQRMHVELGLTHQIPRACERLLVLLVITHHVAGVLAKEALGAP